MPPHCRSTNVHPRWRTLRAAAPLGVALLFAVPADAEPLERSERPGHSLDAPAPPAKPRPPGWLGENVSFEKGYGLAYRRGIRLGASPLVLGVKGPVVRKKKRLGLTVEVRF